MGQVGFSLSSRGSRLIHCMHMSLLSIHSATLKECMIYSHRFKEFNLDRMVCYHLSPDENLGCLFPYSYYIHRVLLSSRGSGLIHCMHMSLVSIHSATLKGCMIYSNRFKELNLDRMVGYYITPRG